MTFDTDSLFRSRFSKSRSLDGRISNVKPPSVRSSQVLVFLNQTKWNKRPAKIPFSR